MYNINISVSDKNGINGAISTITMRNLINPNQYFSEVLSPQDKETDSMLKISIKNVFYIIIIIEYNKN